MEKKENGINKKEENAIRERVANINPLRSDPMESLQYFRSLSEPHSKRLYSYTTM